MARSATRVSNCPRLTRLHTSSFSVIQSTPLRLAKSRSIGMTLSYSILMVWMASLVSIDPMRANGSVQDKSPDQDLPPHISRLTWFGERADFSHDGRRLLFLSKTY